MTTFLHFNCKFDAKIELYQFDNKIFEAFSPSNLSSEIDLVVDNLESFDIKVFALGKKENISYSSKIIFENDILASSSKQVKVFKLPQNHYYFVLFPLVIKKEDFSEFDKVEIEEGKIKTLSLLKDIKKHAKVDVFEPYGDKLKNIESYYVALSKEKQKNINPAVIFLEFFQDLKVLDTKSASTYFTSSFGEKLNEDVLKNFFDDFDDCVLINFYDDFSVLTLNYEICSAKVYGANFENNLISNVYEIE